MTPRFLCPVAVLVALSASPALAATTEYQCHNLDAAAALASIEGQDGVFYRILADLRMRHPMEDAVVEQMGVLSDTLAAEGTTLIYVTVPTKSQAMPQFLPPSAADYTFDSTTATLVYEDIITRLTAQGVLAPDILAALSDPEPGSLPFFKADFHWTPEGARLAAKATGAMMMAQPFYDDLIVSEYRTTELAQTSAFSTMRRALQAYCINELPRVEAVAYKTEMVAGQDEKVSDIFADGDDPEQVVLVGTSFSDAPLSNFAGFLSEYSSLDVVNYAITGGNQFGAMTSYLTSRDFADNPPRFLIWENPIYSNLAQYGPDPMQELVAAAGQTCTVPLNATQTSSNSIEADLTGVQIGQNDVFLADLGAEGPRSAAFTLSMASGITRSALMRRSDRMLASGRFFKPLGSIWHPDPVTLTVTFDRPVSDASTLTLCLSP